MSNRVALKLNFAKKSSLSQPPEGGAGGAFRNWNDECACRPCTIWDSPTPKFEVASVKPCKVQGGMESRRGNSSAGKAGRQG